MHVLPNTNIEQAWTIYTEKNVFTVIVHSVKILQPLKGIHFIVLNSSSPQYSTHNLHSVKHNAIHT